MVSSWLFKWNCLRWLAVSHLATKRRKVCAFRKPNTRISGSTGLTGDSKPLRRSACHSNHCIRGLVFRSGNWFVIWLSGFCISELTVRREFGRWLMKGRKAKLPRTVPGLGAPTSGYFQRTGKGRSLLTKCCCLQDSGLVGSCFHWVGP